MKTRFLAGAFVLFACSWSGRAASMTNDITGNWKGFLETGAVKLRVMFKISKEAHGLVATMDSPDQGGKDMPVNQISFKDSRLHLDVNLVQGFYEGTLDKD